MNTVSVSSNYKLTDDEFEEYQKVFSIICSGKLIENDEIENIQHLNEHSFFTYNNVTAFVQKIAHNFMITKQNVSTIMTMLDVKFSGMISWEVFITAINDWINRSLCFDSLYRKRIGLVLGRRERQVLHHSIASFFLLTAKDVSHNLVRLDFVLELSGAKSDFHLIDLFYDSKDTSHKDPAELLKNFDWHVKEVNMLGTLSQKISYMNGMLAFISRASSTLDLYVHSALLSKLFEFIFKSGLLDQIIYVIIKDENPIYRWESLKALSYIVACLRINNEFFNGAEFVNSDQAKSFLFNSEFLAFLIRFTGVDIVELRDQSLVCLGFIAQVSEESRNYLVSVQSVENFNNYLVKEADDRYLELVAFVLSSIATSMRPDSSYNIHTNILYAFANAGFNLLSIKDSYCLLKAGCELLDVSLPYVNITSENRSVLERLIALASLHDNVLINKFVLATIFQIAEHNDSHTKILMDMNLIQILMNIITTGEHTLRLHSCKILLAIARKGHIMQLFETKALVVIIKSLYDTPHCRWECVKILKTVVFNSNTYISLLVEIGITKALFENLVGFREQDDVLTEVYNYQGAYLNLPFLIDCLNALNTILMAGAVSKSGGSLNIFADYFDRECTDRLQAAIESLFEDRRELKSQIKRSYIKKYSEVGFEQFLMTFIINMRNAHKLKDSESSKMITSQLSSLLFTVNSKFQELNSSGAGSDKLKDTLLEVKCFSAEDFPNGDNRIINVSRAASFSEFRNAIEHKYGYYGPMLISYFNKKNEATVIDDEKVYEKAMSEALENLITYGLASGTGSLRIIIQFNVSTDLMPNTKSREVQCYECGKQFEVVMLYEPTNPDELFCCHNCKLEQSQSQSQSQSQMHWPGIPNMSISQNFPRTPYGFPFK